MTSTTEAVSLPFAEAIRFFRQKANVKTKQWTDVYTAAHSRAFMVASAAGDALVADFRKAVDKAIAEGTSLSEFRKDFDKIVARHGWSGWTGEGSAAGRAWRQEIIYDTNLRAAYAAGRWAQYQHPDVRADFPYLQYHHSGSLHPRLNHLAWDGLVLRADDPFWATNYPPNGWRCGCYTSAVTEGALRRQGKSGPDKAPDLEWEIKKAGDKTAKVPKGIDPGFEYNIGQAWLARTAPGDETVAAAPGMIERFAQAAIAGQIPPQTHIPAAIAPKALAKAFGVEKGVEIRLSADTIHRHANNPKHLHPEATPIIYSEIIEYVVSEGDIYADAQGRISALAEYDGKLWQIGFKKTKKSEIYTTTVHRVNAQEVSRLRKKGKNIQKGEK